MHRQTCSRFHSTNARPPYSSKATADTKQSDMSAQHQQELATFQQKLDQLHRVFAHACFLNCTPESPDNNALKTDMIASATLLWQCMHYENLFQTRLNTHCTLTTDRTFQQSDINHDHTYQGAAAARATNRTARDTENANS